jgi:serine/threonine-protein kinase HipA
VLIGNTDDHARNHSAFWDGRDLSLTPAYDLCPQMRNGREAGQAMQIGGTQGNLSTLANVLSACGAFMLSEAAARELIEQQVAVIEYGWAEACDLAELGSVERERLWGRAVFNPFCFEGWRS